MLSKEVLSEVLKCNVVKVCEQDNHIQNNEVEYQWSELNGDINSTYINIYELSHKCKEWIYDKGYDLVVTRDHSATFVKILLENRTVRFKISETKTETELVFEACEFLYANE